MSIACVTMAMRLRLSDPTEKLVLLAFAEHADADGLSFPSVDLVAAEALCSGRTVQRIIRRFEKAGLLWLVRDASGRGHPATYRVRPEALGRVPEYHELREAQRKGSHPAPAVLEPVEEDHPQGDLLAQKGDTLMSPIKQPSGTQKGDRNGKRGDKNAVKGDTLMSPEPITSNHKERAGARPVDNSRPDRPLEPADQTLSSTSKSKHSLHYNPTQYRHTLQQLEETARTHAIEPRKKWENELAFRNRVNVQACKLSIATNEAHRLHIKDRQANETIDNFERRVSLEAVRNEGIDLVTDPEEARRQALGIK